MTGMIGVVLGTLYLVFKRNLWPLILAHALVDRWPSPRCISIWISRSKTSGGLAPRKDAGSYGHAA
ncbi:hypothetical protein [Maricaulis virginensis]|nr:hypothetical protein [Maricaulis virginensis]